MSVNDEILDASTLHEVRLERLKNNIVRRMISILNKSDAAIFDELEKKLKTLPADSFTVTRLDSLLKSVRELNAEAYNELKGELDTELKGFVDYEAGWQQQLFTNTLPVQVSIASVNPEQVYTAALARPFQGVLLKEALSGLEADKAAKIRNAIRIGYVENKTIDQMVRDIRGTKALNYQDGIIEITRRNAESVVRTATAHMAAFTRQRFMEANSEVIKAERYLAVLDARTTARCQSLSGKIYPVGKGVYPPQHWNCRSIRTAITKSWRELGIDADELPASTQASLNGQVPSEWTYNDWLKRQSVEIQEEVLGIKRAKLYRAGDLPIDRYVNNKGEYYTLEQLRKKDAELFDKAGI
jgi:SPP1 gp7 family putative phage head morphogenesis protein